MNYYCGAMIKYCIVSSLFGFLFACTHNAEKHSLPKVQAHISLDALPICYNDGCSEVKNISVSALSWQSIQQLFVHDQSATDERAAIRQAVAILEQEAARYTPVDNDQPKNNNELGAEGRQDCIDESTNTTHFLRLLAQAHLLKWYQVSDRVYRTLLLVDQHYAAQIIHRETRERYVVDSWHRYNGEPPYIQRYRSWALRLPFSNKENPPLMITQSKESL